MSVVQVWPEGWLAGAQDATVKNVVCGRAWSISDSRERIGAEDSRWNNVRSSGRVVWSTLSQHWEHWADHQARVQARKRVEKRGCRQTRERRTQFRQRRPSNYSASITMPCPHVTGDFIDDPSRLPLALALASITQAVKHCQAHLSSGAIMIKIWRREPRLSETASHLPVCLPCAPVQHVPPFAAPLDITAAHRGRLCSLYLFIVLGPLAIYAPWCLETTCP